MTLRRRYRALAVLATSALLSATLTMPALGAPLADPEPTEDATATSETVEETPEATEDTPEEPTPQILSVTIERTDNLGEDVYVGDTLTYTFTYTNNSDSAFTVFPVAANLDGFLTTGTPNCRWGNLGAGITKQCPTASHVVTADDLATGSFTPTSTWAATRDRAGTDVIAGDIHVTGEATPIREGKRPAAPDPLETPHDYAIGEKVRLATANDAGFHCHRIPALTTTNEGWIIAAWDGRPGTCQDAPQANSIIYRISKDGGKSWTPIRTALEGSPGANKYGYSDPSFVVDRETGTIFLFSVKSYEQGLFGSRLGTDPTDRNVLHANVVESHDGGETWINSRVITDQVSAGHENEWFTRFASSGEGIQLRYGTHKGRLIQQYAIAKNGQNSLYAVSVYSDDHGVTWKPGALTEGSADENKVVELSDGRLLLNSRTQGAAGQRLEAISYDGGETWGPFRHNRDLTDPRNNASIVRAFPDAPQGSARARILLFSNANSTNSRANGTVRISYDDGFTWNSGVVFESGAMAYSTLHPLADGTWGLLYESENYRNIEFMRLDANYLGLSDPGAEIAPDPEPTPDPTPDPGVDDGTQTDPTPIPAHWENTLSGWKWQYEDGSYATSTTVEVGGLTYRFDASGIMVTGWNNTNGIWRYYNTYGSQASGWTAIAGTWYYLDPEDGAMATSWKQIDGTWYHFAANGTMTTGWLHDGSWYYFAPSGSMLTGWQRLGSTWYYFASSGAMSTGWQQIDGRWYYFNASGAWI